MILKQASPENCYTTGINLNIAELGEVATATLHVVDDKGKASPVPTESLTCELVSSDPCRKVGCVIEKREANHYKISYRATSRGRHQLHIKVDGDHIKGSPFPIAVIKKLGTPIKTILDVKQPWGVSVNQRRVIVGENGANCVSVFSSTGKKLLSFGSHGSGPGQFNGIHGVAVDDDGNFFVVDQNNHRIQKFTSDGKFIIAIGKEGSKQLQFNGPRGIVIHPLSKKVYVTDNGNHRIQILNPDLTFFRSFGSYGNGNGQFKNPSGITVNNTGNMYVTDTNNHRIQVFTAVGEYLKTFGQYGKGNGELNAPSGISMDSDDIAYVSEQNNNRVSVFTCEGKFLTSFGALGSRPGEFSNPCGIAVDKDGVIFVCDKRLQIF